MSVQLQPGVIYLLPYLCEGLCLELTLSEPHGRVFGEVGVVVRDTDHGETIGNARGAKLISHLLIMIFHMILSKRISQDSTQVLHIDL